MRLGLIRYALRRRRWWEQMRGKDERRDGLFSYVRAESRIPKDHPLRAIRRITDEALKALDTQFAALYAEHGRPSIPPEQLLRALLLQAFYSIRSERQLMEQLDYNLLFRWFVGLSVDDPIWVPTVFSKNRDRLLAGDIAADRPQCVQAPRPQQDREGAPQHAGADEQQITDPGPAAGFGD